MARPRSEQARAKMLDAAAKIALSAGVKDFTIEEVARRSGVAKTTIYRHFPTQADLLVAALDGRMPVPTVPDTGIFRQDLVEFLRNVLPIFGDPVIRTIFLDIFASSARDPDLRRRYSSMMQNRAVALRTIYDRAVDRGEISAELDFEIAFDFIEGPLIVRSLFRPGDLAETDVESLVDRMLRALT